MFRLIGVLLLAGIVSAQYPYHGLYHGGPALVKAVAAPVVKYAAPIVKYAAPLVKHVEVEAPAHYDFSYSVHDGHTGDVKSQSESRKGDVVHGQYSLIDADGYLRTVDYTSDAHNGFNAVVRREPLGHKVVKAVAPVAKVAYAPAPVVHYAPAPAVHYAPKVAIAPAVTHVAVHAPAYAYSH